MASGTVSEIVEMPPNKSKPGQNRTQETMANHVSNELLVQQLKDAMDTTRSLSRTLQDEIVLNTSARMSFKKDIEHLCETVAELRKIYSGNGRPSLEVRLVNIENNLESINSNRDIENDKKIRKSERFWRFIIQNTPLIFTWIGLLVWVTIQFLNSYNQAHPPTP